MNIALRPHIQDHLRRRVAEARSLEELAWVGINHIKFDLGDRTRMTSGPITTGGENDVRRNLHRLAWADYKLSHDYPVLDHGFFEPKIALFHHRRKASGAEGYYWEIIYDFYQPLFETGHVIELFMLPGWESSLGCKEEKKICERLGIRITDLEPEFFDDMPAFGRQFALAA